MRSKKCTNGTWGWGRATAAAAVAAKQGHKDRKKTGGTGRGRGRTKRRRAFDEHATFSPDYLFQFIIAALWKGDFNFEIQIRIRYGNWRAGKEQRKNKKIPIFHHYRCVEIKVLPAMPCVGPAFHLIYRILIFVQHKLGHQFKKNTQQKLRRKNCRTTVGNTQFSCVFSYRYSI